MRYSGKHPRCVFVGAAGFIAVLCFLGCRPKVKLEDNVVSIGGKTYSRASLDALTRMRRMYPTTTGTFFPRERSGVTLLVETEVVYDKARNSAVSRKVRESRDGSWKRKYFLGQLYLHDVLDKNLGYTQEEIESFYSRNRSSFTTTIKVPSDTIRVTGVSGEKSDSVVYRDSVYVRPVGQVVAEIAEKLFFAANPPDSAFMARYIDEEVDSVQIRRSWIATVRHSLPEFFMKKLYRQKKGSAYPESFQEWYGQGKMIVPEDMDVILNWIPPQHREIYQGDSNRVRELAEWLMKWELFSSEAQTRGFASRPEVQEVLQWADRFEIASRYVDEEIVPPIKSSIVIDTAMGLYAFWDEKGSVIRNPDTADFHPTLERIAEREIDAAVDGEIYKMRRKKRVTFLQDDWRDDKIKDPAVLLAQADSSRDAGNYSESESLYRILVQSFAFAPEGRKALIELAKIQTENEQYFSAIENYRRYLVGGQPDEVNKCNTFFMIGFIYDEYQNKPELAEANYTWVLKHMPECELADDAEFMCAHLDEPMTSVEELRGEALRQGRNIDDDEPVDDGQALAPGST